MANKCNIRICLYIDNNNYKRVGAFADRSGQRSRIPGDHRDDEGVEIFPAS